ncbi:uncharacterized protein LOC121369595 isoform X2 [Gigantopelta aegis]|nr:uncharacterized protein LOC121369595 isoform X2 [Gigantopelta aegis]
MDTDKRQHLCHKCNHDYNVFDRKPKLLRCLHSICEHCYYANKHQKDQQCCPRCKDVSGGDVDSQIDCVTINEMVIQTLNEAFDVTDLYSKQTPSLHAGGSETLDGTTDDTKGNGPAVNGDTGGSGYGITKEKRSYTEQDRLDDPVVQDAGENHEDNDKTYNGFDWFDKLFHHKSNAVYTDSGEFPKDQQSREESTYKDWSGEAHSKDSLSLTAASQANSEQEQIPNSNCATEAHYSDTSPAVPQTEAGDYRATGAGVDEAKDLKDKVKLIVCSTSRHNDQAVCYCPDCHIFLCAQCQTKHADDLLSKYHRCHGIDVLRALPLSEMESSAHCIVHPEYPLNYFCQHHTCKKLACIKCATNLHNKHGKSGIEDAIALEKTNLKERLQEIDRKLSLKNKEANTPTSEPYGETSQDKIFQTLLEVTERRKQELLNEVDMYYRNHDVIAAHLIDLQYTKYYCDMALAYTTKSELLEVCHTIHTRAEELLKIQIPLDKNPRESLVFVNEDRMYILQEIEGLISGLSIGKRRKRKAVKGKTKSEESVC